MGSVDVNAIVTNCVEDLSKKLKKVDVIKSNAAWLYKQDELMEGLKKNGYPAIGIIYAGLKGTANKGKAANIIIDVYVIGGDKCKGHELSGTTGLLDKMRSAIMCGVADVKGAKRVWEFVWEVPTPLKVTGKQKTEDVGAYVQRWQTALII